MKQPVHCLCMAAGWIVCAHGTSFGHRASLVDLLGYTKCVCSFRSKAGVMVVVVTINSSDSDSNNSHNNTNNGSIRKAVRLVSRQSVYVWTSRAQMQRCCLKVHFCLTYKPVILFAAVLLRALQVIWQVSTVNCAAELEKQVRDLQQAGTDNTQVNGKTRASAHCFKEQLEQASKASLAKDAELASLKVKWYPTLKFSSVHRCICCLWCYYVL